MLKKFLLILFISSSLFAQSKDVTLLLSWKHQFQFAGYYMAIEKGFYKQEGLNVMLKEPDLNSDSARDVSTRKYEFAIKHSPVILDKINNYPNIKLLAAINQSSPLVLISTKHNSLRNLKGKVIQISKNDRDNASINAMLRFNGLHSQNTISKKEGFSLDALLNKEIDFQTAYSSNELYSLAKRKTPFYIFDPKDYGYDFYSDILFTSKELINEKPDLVKGFYTASMKGWKYAYEHIDESIEVILKNYNTQNKTKEALLFEANMLKKSSYRKDIAFGNLNPMKLKEISTTYHLLGFVDKYRKIDYNDFIYDFAKKETLNTEYMFMQIYHKYDGYIKFFLSLFIFALLGLLYIRYKLKSLLAVKTAELAKSYRLFDEYTIASRTDLYGKITYVTKAFCEASGYTREELIGKNHRVLKNSEVQDKSIYKDMWMSISSGHTWRGEFNNVTKGGLRYWTKAVISPLFDKKSNIVGYEGVRHDITAKKLLEEYTHKLEEDVKTKTSELEKYTEYLDTLFDINPNITYVINANELIHVNQAFLEFTGTRSLEHFKENNRCICELFSQDKHNKNLDTHTLHCDVNKQVNIQKDGELYTFRLSTKNFNADGKVQQLVTLENITEIQKLATTDKLTGIHNRVKLDVQLSKNFDYYIEHGDLFSVIIIDIDLFKHVNDTHGHLIGDEILKDFAKIVAKNIRDTDIVGRWGGEEFLIICPNTNKEGSLQLAQKVRQKISEHIFARNLKITASFGVCDVHECRDLDILLSSADEALYRAKENGRNRVECYRC